jgi:hypothetical protein
VTIISRRLDASPRRLRIEEWDESAFSTPQHVTVLANVAKFGCREPRFTSPRHARRCALPRFFSKQM